MSLTYMHFNVIFFLGYIRMNVKIKKVKVPVMSSRTVEFVFHGHAFEAVLFTDFIPTEEMDFLCQNLVDHIEESDCVGNES